jgi:hypothetical protein
VAGQFQYGSWDRTTETGQLGQVNLDWTAGAGEPGQNREDKSGHDSNARTVVSRDPWSRLLGQDSWQRTAGIGQPGRDSQDRTARTGQPEKTLGALHPREETEDKTDRTGQQEHDKGIGQR